MTATIKLVQRVEGVVTSTPSRWQYKYSIRDSPRILLGLALLPKGGCDLKSATRLWVHECLRVLCDRVTGGRDDGLLSELQQCIIAECPDGDAELVASVASDVYVFIKRDSVDPSKAASARNIGAAAAMSSQDASAVRATTGAQLSLRGGDTYLLLSVKEGFVDAIVEMVSDYNADTVERIQLIPCMLVATQLARLVRIVRQPGGHAMLLGAVSVGRKSLTRLAGFLAEMPIVRVDSSRDGAGGMDAIKQCVLRSSTAGRPIILLASDNEVRSREESAVLLQAIYSVITTGARLRAAARQCVRARRDGVAAGTCPGLLSEEELESAIAEEAVFAEAERLELTPSRQNLCTVFFRRVRRYLRAVVVTDPAMGCSAVHVELLQRCGVMWVASASVEAMEAAAQQSLPAELVAVPGVVPALVAVHEGMLHEPTRFCVPHAALTMGRFVSFVSTFRRIVDDRSARLSARAAALRGGEARLAAVGELIENMHGAIEGVSTQKRVTAAEVEGIVTEIEQEDAAVAGLRQIAEGEQVRARAC